MDEKQKAEQAKQFYFPYWKNWVTRFFEHPPDDEQYCIEDMDSDMDHFYEAMNDYAEKELTDYKASLRAVIEKEINSMPEGDLTDMECGALTALKLVQHFINTATPLTDKTEKI